MTASVRAYRASGTEGATHIDILLACYDALAEDIQFAGKFASQGDIAARCRRSERALLLIGHLESWVTLLDDADLAAGLASFYEYLRAEILRLQLSTDLDDYMNLVLAVCETRAAWQKKHSLEIPQTEANVESPYPGEEAESTISRFMISA